MFLLIILILFLLLICYFFAPLEIPFLTGLIGAPTQAEKITWGVNFSQKHTQSLGLDWQKTYLALLDDLKVKNLKIITQWDLIEPKQGQYFFDDLDWQIAQAENKGAKILLVIGLKTGRWPECHIPDWAKNLTKQEREERILKLIEKIVSNYQDSTSIISWQVENEPFFPFGECPEIDREFLQKEINLVKSLDNKQRRQIVVSDSGEGSFWFTVAKLGDVVGITMYKKVWFSQINAYVKYPLPPVFYWRKAQIIKNLFNKNVICIELQAEPWGKELLYTSPLEEQEKTMNLKQFKQNIAFAKKTGLDTFYLWGAEWWYWMKTKQNNSEIWQEASKLF
ncbi:hypothetical protein KAU40_02690 [Candidatus Parcubacteria bacterium]|nr:hypothetical protein [Candidatus Parcubacteria bacterium]